LKTGIPEIRTRGVLPVSRSEGRTRSALMLESIALRHQIAVLERSRTRRPCFRRIDRLLWTLLSCWVFRSVRASRYAPNASAVRSVWWSPESAQQSSSDRRCGAKSAIRSSGVTKAAVARDSRC